MYSCDISKNYIHVAMYVV